MTTKLRCAQKHLAMASVEVGVAFGQFRDARAECTTRISSRGLFCVRGDGCGRPKRVTGALGSPEPHLIAYRLCRGPLLVHRPLPVINLECSRGWGGVRGFFQFYDPADASAPPSSSEGHPIAGVRPIRPLAHHKGCSGGAARSEFPARPPRP